MILISAVDHAEAMQFTYLSNTNIISQLFKSTEFEAKTTMLPHYLSLLLFLSRFSPNAVAQNMVADCGPILLPLAPCGPFVQGRTPAPVHTCCEHVDVLYKYNQTCLCVLLANSSLESPFPINTTLALQLPLLCKLNIDPSTCPGASLPTLSPPTQVSLGAKAKPKSNATASPVIMRSPTRPRFTGVGVQESAEVRLDAESSLLMLLMAAIFFYRTDLKR